RPLALGADICMCSATKYMNGHSDVIMGLVSVNSDDLNNRLRFLQNSIGAVPSPFDCYLCCRGLKTLQIRMEKHFKNGMAVACFLQSNPRVEKVIYPGLPSHPQHELAKRQCTGCTGMVSFYIKGALRHAEAFLKSLKVFTLAESLGGYESLAELPAIMTHASVPEKDRATLGISDTLIRLSVGLEDETDLLEDLDQALKAADSVSLSRPPVLELTSQTRLASDSVIHCLCLPNAGIKGNEQRTVLQFSDTDEKEAKMGNVLLQYDKCYKNGQCTLAT
ncbi:hypothetical protein STEG23_025698, partial [Scotinomys teguina]